MTAPKRIQLRRTKGWRKPEGAIVVARPSRWGNPFRIVGLTMVGPSWTVARESWGHVPAEQCTSWYVSSTAMSTAYAVDQFATLLTVRSRDEPARLHEWLAPLVGRDLACWCPLGQPCHADVLLDIASTADDL